MKTIFIILTLVLIGLVAVAAIAVAIWLVSSKSDNYIQCQIHDEHYRKDSICPECYREEKSELR